MPPFCPPQILFRLILGLLPVLRQHEKRTEYVVGMQLTNICNRCNGVLTHTHWYNRHKLQWLSTVITWFVHQSTCGCRYHYLPILHDHYHRNTRQPMNRNHSEFRMKVIKSKESKVIHEMEKVKDLPTCLPLCILFRRSTGVLPVVTHTPARVLLYTSFSSITPWPFSCYKHVWVLHTSLVKTRKRI